MTFPRIAPEIGVLFSNVIHDVHFVCSPSMNAPISDTCERSSAAALSRIFDEQNLMFVMFKEDSTLNLPFGIQIECFKTWKAALLIEEFMSSKFAW